MQYVCVSCWTSKPDSEMRYTYKTIFVRHDKENMQTGICTSCHHAADAQHHVNAQHHAPMLKQVAG